MKKEEYFHKKNSILGFEYVSGLLSCFNTVLRLIHGNIYICQTDYSIP